MWRWVWRLRGWRCSCGVGTDMTHENKNPLSTGGGSLRARVQKYRIFMTWTPDVPLPCGQLCGHF
jgi:hypothetical protein